MVTSVNILGTEYQMRYAEEADAAKIEDANGYCELYSKEIVIGIVPESGRTFNNVDEFVRKVMRHEIIHAFLHESGLSSNSEWALDEEMVDWIALQFPKMLQAFTEAECI